MVDKLIARATDNIFKKTVIILMRAHSLLRKMNVLDVTLTITASISQGCLKYNQT